MRRTRAIAVFGLLVALAACDDGPTVPNHEDDDEDAVAEAMATLVTEEWSQLPSALGLEDAVRDELAGRPDGATLRQRLSEADLARVMSLDAEEGLSLELTDHGRLAAAEVIVAVRGAAIAVLVIGEVERVLARIDREVPAARPGSEASRTLDQARAALAQAGAAFAAGGTVEALADGLAASDQVRELAPEARARAVIEKAEMWLSRATDAAGTDPAPAIAEALGRAESHLRAAKDAYDQGEYRAAVHHAVRSIALSRWVIRQVQGGDDDDSLEARVRALIETANRWLDRATEAAGPTPPSEVVEALRDATELLDEAVRAFEAGEYEAAARKALESIRICRRIVAGTGARGG